MAIGFDIDPEKCTECERCMAACTLVKLGKIQPGQARIDIVKSWPGLPDINVCRFDGCEGQPCISVCPVEAIYNLNGIVLINRETCTGCGACVDGCPYHAIWMDNEEPAYKCDFCGGESACVPECVTEALRVKGS
jgi:Fe-S-cluster-containing dehydrogenase component